MLIYMLCNNTYFMGVQNLIHHTKRIALYNEMLGAINKTFGNSSDEVFQ